MGQYPRTKAGFTLVELLVAMTIIGLLIAAGAVSLNNAQISARDSRRIGDVTSLGKAVDAYSTANRGRYPVPDTSVACEQSFAGQLNPYLPNTSSFPKDPRPVSSGACATYSAGYKYYGTNELGTNPAKDLQQKYIFVTGLEKDISQETAVLTSGAGITGISSVPGRKAYYLPGPFCSTDC